MEMYHKEPDATKHDSSDSSSEDQSEEEMDLFNIELDAFSSDDE